MNYEQWNEAIGKYFFEPSKRNQLVFFSVEPEALRRCALPGVHFESGKQAQEDFVRAVRERIARWDWAVGRLDGQKYPGFLGALAAQVLTVHLMHQDDTWRATAFWPRFRGLLGQPEVTEMPTGLTGGRHQELWKSLAVWLNDPRYCGGRNGILRLPPEEGGFRHIRLPMSQGLLRLEDVCHLPHFFREASFQPGESLSAEEMLEDLLAFRFSSSLFSRYARDVLKCDVRQLYAAEQAATRLQEWDGTLEDRVRPSGPVHRMWLDYRRQVLRGGLLRISESGLPQRVPDCSLESLLRGAVGKGQWKPLVSRRFLAVYDSASEYFIEARFAGPGDRVLLLVPRFEMGAWRSGADRVAEKDTLYTAEVVSGGYVSWSLLGLKLRSDIDTDVLTEPWSRLIRPRARLVAHGGLRLRRGVWMAGAGPTIRIVGTSACHLWVDDKSCDVDPETGEVRTPLLDAPGLHTVSLPGRQRMALGIVVRESRLSWQEFARGGWVKRAAEWPESAQEVEESEPVVRGMAVLGRWTSMRRSQREENLLYVRLILALQGRPMPGPLAIGESEIREAEGDERPLIRALAAAARARRPMVDGGKDRP